jgi:hypothetical protein
MNAKSVPGSRKGNANKIAHVRRDPIHRVESAKRRFKLLKAEYVLYKSSRVGISEGV